MMNMDTVVSFVLMTNTANFLLTKITKNVPKELFLMLKVFGINSCTWRHKPYICDLFTLYTFELKKQDFVQDATYSVDKEILKGSYSWFYSINVARRQP